MSLNLSPVSPPWRKLLPAAGAMVWILALCWWHRLVVIDDPWITFQYARNLVEGNGLVFNPGERLEGYSNFTWVLLAALAHLANLEPLGFARLVSVALVAKLLFLFAFFGRQCGMKHPGTAALLLAGCYPLAVWTMGGLETILVAYLVMVLCLGCAWAQGRSPAMGGAATGLVAGLLVLSRPEGAMYMAVPLMVFLLCGRDRSGALRFLACLGTFAAIFAVYTGWRWAYFGDILPNTVRAKVGGGPLATIMEGFRYGADYLGGVPIFLLLLGVFGLRKWNSFAGHPPAQPLIVACAAALGIQVLFTIGVGGDWMPAYRFLVPALAPLAVLAAMGMSGWHPLARTAVVVALLGGGLVQAKLNPQLNWCRWAAKESGGELLVAPLAEVGRHLGALDQPGALLAGTEAGVIPYHARMRFLDMLGLVDAHIASLPGGLHEKYDPGYVLSRRPDYIVLGVTLADGTERGTWPPDALLFEDETFRAGYREVARWQRPMPTPDYEHIQPGAMILYERRPD